MTTRKADRVSGLSIRLDEVWEAKRRLYEETRGMGVGELLQYLHSQAQAAYGRHSHAARRNPRRGLPKHSSRPRAMRRVRSAGRSSVVRALRTRP
jgi:hypothetical protein